MILIPHGWITSSVAPSRRENTIVVAGRALHVGSGAREGYIRAWPARGPRTVRTSALRGAQRCAAPAAAWRHPEACYSAALGGARRARWYSVALGGAQRPRRRGCARQHVAQQRSAALGGTQRRSAALGARGSTAVLGSIVAQDSAGFGARSGAQTPALGGAPLHSAELCIVW